MAFSSKKTLRASSKETPCFLTLIFSLSRSHSNRRPSICTLYVKRPGCQHDGNNSMDIRFQGKRSAICYSRKLSEPNISLRWASCTSEKSGPALYAASIEPRTTNARESADCDPLDGGKPFQLYGTYMQSRKRAASFSVVPLAVAGLPFQSRQRARLAHVCSGRGHRNFTGGSVKSDKVFWRNQ